MSTALTILKALELIPTIVDEVTGAITVTREAVDAVRGSVEGVDDAVSALAKPSSEGPVSRPPPKDIIITPTEEVPYLTAEVVAKREVCNQMVGMQVTYLVKNVTLQGEVEMALPTHVIIDGQLIFYSSLAAIKAV